MQGVIDFGLVGSTISHSSHLQGHEPEHHAGYHEGRRCSRDTYPESCITKYSSIRRETCLVEGGVEVAGFSIVLW